MTASIAQQPSQTEIDTALAGTKLYVLDFEGTMIATEVIMQISFVALLEKYGISAEKYGDIYAVEKQMVGRTVKDIVTTLMNEYGLNPKLPEDILKESATIEDENKRNKFLREEKINQLLKEREEIYVGLVKDYKLGIFGFIKPILEKAKAEGAEVILLSNGVHNVIEGIAKADGVWDFFNHVFASDSEERKTVGDKLGVENPGDKAEFLARYIAENGYMPEDVSVFEDNSKTLQKMQKAIKDRGMVGKLKEFYVVHEFNWDKDFTPNTGIVFDGDAPDALCKAWKISKPPGRNAPNTSNNYTSPKGPNDARKPFAP